MPCSGIDTPAYVELDVNDAIRDVLALTAGALQIAASGPDRIARRVAAGVGRSVALQQVVMNLIFNGADAMSSVTDRQHVMRIWTQIDAAGIMLVAVANFGTGLDTGMRIASSIRCSPRNLPAWVWGCRSAGRSSKPMAADCGRRRIPNGTVFQFTVPTVTKVQGTDAG